ncbi:multidrug resistance transport transmembrane protein [Colletotrichum tofieldiae]|nr:multidrug resistance transport transmembrane protein [Colletotrichum tofieldiae]
MVRSGWGMRAKTLPSLLLTPATPPGLPFGLRLSTYLSGTRPSSPRLSRALGLAKEARPSPCETAMGKDEPSMPWRKTDGVAARDSSILTMVKRASNCLLAFSTNVGQFSVPGISSLRRVIIWQPLQTPSANVSGRLKKFSNSWRACLCSRMDCAQPTPAPKTSPYEKPPPAATPTKSASDRPARTSDMCTSMGSKPAALKAKAISRWLLTPTSRRMATRGALRSRLPRDAVRGKMFSDGEKTRVGGVGDEGVLAVGARRVVSLPLHGVRRPRPPLLHLGALEADDGRVAAVADVEGLVGLGLDDAELANEPRGRTAGGEAALEVGLVLLADLEDGAELLVEEGLEDVVGGAGLGDAVEHEVDAAAAGEHHLGNGGHETTVGDVVVGEDDAALVQLLQSIKVVDVHEDRLANVLDAAQLGSPGVAHVIDDGNSGDDDGHGRRDALGLTRLAVLPRRLHRGGVLADGDGNLELGAQLHADSADGLVETGTLARVVDGGHPVGGQLHAVQLTKEVGGAEVEQTLGDRHAGRGSRGDESELRLLSHSHDLAGAGVGAEAERGCGDGAVGDGGLPGTDHLVADGQATNGPVADGDEERLGADGRHAEDALRSGGNEGGRVGGLGNAGCSQSGGGGEGRQIQSAGLDDTLEAAARREEGVEGEIDGHGVLRRVAVAEGQLGVALSIFGNDSSNIREGAPFAACGFGQRGSKGGRLTADADEAVDVILVDKQDVTLLSLVAPNLQRAHAAVCAVDLTQLELATEASILDKLGEGVGQTASADIVDHGNGVLLAKGGAGVDDHLGAALHLGVATLNTGEIQLGGVLVRGTAGGGSSTETDEHGGATEDDSVGAIVDVSKLLESVLRADGSDTTGDHDGLVVTAPLRRVLLANVGQESAEATEQAGSAELVVEASTTDGGLQHDVKTAGKVGGLAKVNLPRGLLIGNQQVRHPETAESGLGGRTPTDGALVANLTSGTSGGTGEGGDGGRVVVRLDLDEDVNDLLGELPATSGVVRGPEAGSLSLENGGVVTVGGDGEVGVGFVGVLDHLEETLAHLLLVNGPVGVELLVAAVL